MMITRNNVIGFDNDAGQHIFDILERLRIGKEIEGTGTGLAICKKIGTRSARRRNRRHRTTKPGSNLHFFTSGREQTTAQQQKGYPTT